MDLKNCPYCGAVNQAKNLTCHNCNQNLHERQSEPNYDSVMTMQSVLSRLNSQTNSSRNKNADGQDITVIQRLTVVTEEGEFIKCSNCGRLNHADRSLCSHCFASLYNEEFLSFGQAASNGNAAYYTTAPTKHDEQVDGQLKMQFDDIDAQQNLRPNGLFEALRRAVNQTNDVPALYTREEAKRQLYNVKQTQSTTISTDTAAGLTETDSQAAKQQHDDEQQPPKVQAAAVRQPYGITVRSEPRPTTKSAYKSYSEFNTAETTIQVQNKIQQTQQAQQKNDGFALTLTGAISTLVSFAILMTLGFNIFDEVKGLHMVSAFTSLFGLRFGDVFSGATSNFWLVFGGNLYFACICVSVYDIISFTVHMLANKAYNSKVRFYVSGFSMIFGLTMLFCLLLSEISISQLGLGFQIVITGCVLILLSCAVESIQAKN